MSSSSVQNHSSVLSSKTQVLICEEFSERIEYSVKDLHEHALGIGDVPNESVDACVRSEYGYDFATLERVTQVGSLKEKDMYIPLSSIFRVIEEISRSHNRKYNRHFVLGSSRKVDPEAPLTDKPTHNEVVCDLIEVKADEKICCPVPASVDELSKRNIFHRSTDTEVALGTKVKREHKTVLHLAMLHDVGRPLWEYHNEMEFINGIKAILGGLEYMASKNIRHCDISAGNVYLRNSPENPVEAGFIADMELASIPLQETMFALTGEPSFMNHRTRIPLQSKCGPMMMGTAKFMATEVLQAIRDGNTLVRTVHHDLESLLFVIIYALYRKALSANRSSKPEIEVEFKRYFGSHTVDGILGKRSQIYSQGGLVNLMEEVSDAMTFLLMSIRYLIRNQNLAMDNPPIPLRYENDPDDLEDNVVSIPIEFAMVYKRLRGAEWYIPK